MSQRSGMLFGIVRLNRLSTIVVPAGNVTTQNLPKVAQNVNNWNTIAIKTNRLKKQQFSDFHSHLQDTLPEWWCLH